MIIVVRLIEGAIEINMGNMGNMGIVDSHHFYLAEVERFRARTTR